MTPSRMLLLVCTYSLMTGCDHGHHGETVHHEHDLFGPVKVTTPALQRMLEFHGHVGPYVVLGFRAGMLARKRLDSPGYFDLDATALCPLEKPMSCFLDGIQLGSGCTAGKRNLNIQEGPSIQCTFQSKNGRAILVHLKPDMPGKIKKWIQADGIEETGRRIMTLPEEEAFKVEAP